MTVSEESWVAYIERLRAVSDKAANEFLETYKRVANPLSEAGRKALTWKAFVVGRDYGEAAAELACEMYDSMVVAEGMSMGRPAGWIEPAVPANTATIDEAAKTVNGVLKISQNPVELAGAVSRLVKMASVDTVLQNVERDEDKGAQFAWIPHGDTCPFCIALASRGWRKSTAEAMRNGHAEHIHSNCDCTYGVRFNGKTKYKGYDSEKYLKQYDDARKKINVFEDKKRSHPEAKKGGKQESIKTINAMRREQYRNMPEAEKEALKARKRELYAERKELSQNT